MDNIYTASYLKDVLNHIMINDYPSDNLLTLLKYLEDKETYDNYECNSLILIILSLLEEQDHLPVIDLFMKQLKLKLIFNCYSQTSCSCNTPAEKTDCCTPTNKTEFSEEDYANPEVMAKFFWDFYKTRPFCPKPNDEYRLPAEGDVMDLGVRNTETFPGKEYFMRFQVNHKGEILKWLQKPQLKKSYGDFNAIYQGLLGEIMEYQKVN